MKKKILRGSLIILTLLIIWQWDLIIYGINQAQGQLRVIRGAVPIGEVLADPEFPDSLKQKIRLTMEVRKYATEVLGLENSENYTTLYDQKGKPILWNLSASEKYELKPYTWYFPFLGSVPYKGYFELKPAQDEEKELRKSGYDTRIRTVGGWSTLGILKDPILSNMLRRGDGALAELIIHELTHSTIFVKNNIDFNENLASFIGVRGAELFLRKHFGDSSTQLIEYLNSEKDNKVYTRLILNGTEKLDSVYSTFDASMTDTLKDSLKALTIRQITESLDSNHFYNEQYYHLFDEELPNNAYFMAFIRYHAQEDSLTGVYQKHGENLPRFIKALKSQYGR